MDPMAKRIVHGLLRGRRKSPPRPARTIDEMSGEDNDGRHPQARFDARAVPVEMLKDQAGVAPRGCQIGVTTAGQRRGLSVSVLGLAELSEDQGRFTKRGNDPVGVLLIPFFQESLA